MEQTRVLFCTCDSEVARCQSQHQCHVLRINSMFEAYCLAAVNQIDVIHEVMNGCKSLKIQQRLALKILLIYRKCIKILYSNPLDALILLNSRLNEIYLLLHSNKWFILMLFLCLASLVFLL